MKKLNLKEQKQRNLYLRKLALGEIQGPPTGRASVDRPWLKYYSEKTIQEKLPSDTIYGYLKSKNGKELELLSNILVIN